MDVSSQAGSPFGEIVGYSAEQLSSSSHCSSQGDPCSDGIHLDEIGAGQLRLVSQATSSGAVLAVCPYLDQYVLASAGNTVSYHSSKLSLLALKLFCHLASPLISHSLSFVSFFPKNVEKLIIFL